MDPINTILGLAVKIIVPIALVAAVGFVFYKLYYEFKGGIKPSNKGNNNVDYEKVKEAYLLAKKQHKKDTEIQELEDKLKELKK